MPVADENGDLSYERTISADQLPKGTLDARDHLHVVQHGVDANDNNKDDLDGSANQHSRSRSASKTSRRGHRCRYLRHGHSHGRVDTGGADRAQLSAALVAGAGITVLAVTGSAVLARRTAPVSNDQ